MSLKRKIEEKGEQEREEKRKREEIFSKLYSKIEETALSMESSVTTRGKLSKLEKDVEQYKQILEARYKGAIERAVRDESVEDPFYYYNGCHGYLEHEQVCDPYTDIPSPVKVYILNKKKPVTFIIHKKVLVFNKVNVGNFTETADIAFQVDKEQYHRYLKLEYKWNEKEKKVELTIYVYNNNSQPIKIDPQEGIPNIRFEYHNMDFNMGYFPLIPGPTESVFYVSRCKITEGGFYGGSYYVFPKLVADFEYKENDESNYTFNSSLFSTDESLLDRCFEDLYEYYGGEGEGEEEGEEEGEDEGEGDSDADESATPPKKRARVGDADEPAGDADRDGEINRFNDENVEEIVINIFNSSCLYSNEYVRGKIQERYEQWSKIMAHEIEISSEERPLKKARVIRSGVKGNKKKNKKKKNRTKGKKTKRKTKRSSKKKRRNTKRNKRTKRTKRTKRSSKKK